VNKCKTIHTTRLIAYNCRSHMLVLAVHYIRWTTVCVIHVHNTQSYIHGTLCAKATMIASVTLYNLLSVRHISN